MWKCISVFYGLVLVGCTADLLPLEEVIPGDVPTDLYPSEVEGFGGQVLLAESGFWATSDEASVVFSGAVEVLDLGLRGQGHFLWSSEETFFVGVAGHGVFDERGDLLFSVPDARQFAGQGALWVAAGDGRVIASDGREWSLPDPRKAAVDQDRIAVLSCESLSCGIYLLGDEITYVGEGDPAGDVGFWNGTLWWGLPDTGTEDAAGTVVSEDGAVVSGLPGDNLGRVLGGGFTSGSLNWRIQPRRLRIVGLEEEKVFALDRSAGSMPVSLDGDGDRLLVGVPGWAEKGGAVVVVGDLQLP